MNPRRMLYVDDDVVLREKTVEVLGGYGWTVDTAQDGEEALARIRESGTSYDVIVLDLRMPKLQGEEVLERIKEEGLSVPPIIVLSAYIEAPLKNKCNYLGAAHVLAKPYEPAHLAQLAALPASGVPLSNTPLEFDEGLIEYIVSKREESLRAILMASSGKEDFGRRCLEPLLVVGRRWNSWYPSVFPVMGGAYAVVGPAADHRESAAQPGLCPAAVIDPGFRFLEVFRAIGIPWADLESCVITHNHPDHMGGIFELMAARHALGRKTRAICNPSSCEMLGDCAGYSLDVKQLDESPMDLFRPYLGGGRWLGVRVKGFKTAHEEIGRQNSSRGVCIMSEAGAQLNEREVIGELVILGDTEYDRSEHREAIVGMICRPTVNVVVLHIGCSQFKQATGKHLYLKGLQQLLSDMDAQLGVIKYRGKQLVLVSEWGLEHATGAQVEKAFGRKIAGYNEVSPILETIRFMQKGLRKIVLLPADIGLSVGIDSGKVYLGERIGVEPTDITLNVSEEGIVYATKQGPIRRTPNADG